MRNKLCKFLDDIPLDKKYLKYMSKRYGLEDNIEYLEESFWKLWKNKYFSNTEERNKEDSYNFICIKSKFHKK